MRKLPTRKLLASIVAGALFVPQSGFTLGLGEIEVNSALNQKLRADIELLSATPEDAEKIIVKLASRKEFSRAGLDRPYSLSDLRFKSEIIDGVPHIKVSTGSPVREPFLNFLIEIDWPNGHLLREYTVLLDPPVFMTNATADTAESRPASPLATESRPASSSAVYSGATLSAAAPAPGATTSAPVASKQAAPASTFIPAPVVQQQTPRNQPPGSYRIQAGDTSWSLADAMRPNQSITVPQMMFAMLRTNPEAFIDGNINGLKRGYILRVPDAEQISTISKADARDMMKQHWALWREYLQAQSGGQPSSAMPADGSASADGTNDGVNSADNAHLAIVSAGSGASTAGSSTDPSQMSAQELRAELALARERVETERVEKEALQSRISVLEQNMGNREGLLVVENEGLSGVQSLNDTAADTESTDAESTMAQSEGVESEITESTTESETLTSTDDEHASELVSSDLAGNELAGNEQTEKNEASADQDTEATDTDAVFTDEIAGEVDSEGADTDQTIDSQATDNQAVATDTAASQPPGADTAPTDPLTQLLNDPKMLAAAGGGLLLIVALIALMLKRRKAGPDDETVTEVEDSFMDLESLADDIAEETAAEGAAGDKTGDDTTANNQADGDETVNSESALSDDADKTVATEETPRDDVIAEADVYLAYGIYQQAEELLNQAITDNPDRLDYRIKLAESYYASKNATAFAEVATEIKSRIEDEDSPEWNKIQVMGSDLCADDPMFKGAEVSDFAMDETVADDTIIDGPIMELDDDVNENSSGEEETVIPDLDLTSESLADDTLELPETDASAEAEEVAMDEVAAEPVEEIEFDISDAGAIEEADATDDDFSLDIDASELDIESLDITDDLDATDEAASDEAASEDMAGDNTTNIEEDIEEEVLDLADVDLGLDDDDSTDEAEADDVHDLADADLTFGLDDAAIDSESEAEIVEDISLDLSDEIEPESLDGALDESETVSESLDEVIPDNVAAISSETDTASTADEPTEAKTIPAANDDSSDEGDFDLSSLDDVDEISTKLDLARAYLDMGDAEGTRGILEEVLIDGNDEQKQEANELLSKLAS